MVEISGYENMIPDPRAIKGKHLLSAWTFIVEGNRGEAAARFPRKY